MKMLSDKDSIVRQTMLIVGGILQSAVWMTVASNFGLFHKVTLIFYALSILVYYIIYLLWKQ
jgi:hypothetical protein